MLDNSYKSTTARKLRVLITTDTVGGVWQYTRDLVASLSSSGHTTLVCTLGPSPSSSQLAQLHALGSHVSVEQNTAPLEWMSGSWSAVDEAGQWLLKQSRVFRSDLVHLNSFSFAVLPWPCPVLVGAHSCVETWWRAVHGCSPDAAWAEYLRRVKAGLHAADVIVAPSASLAREVEQAYGLNPFSIRVIYNSSALREAAHTAKEPFCLAAGRFWDQAKNFCLLQAIAEQSPWPIYVAGDSGDVTAGNNLRLLGNLERSEFVEYLDRASIFLHPAWYEPFGLAVLEAARSRCCLLLSDIPSLRELWADTACFLSPANSAAWVSAIQQLTSDEAARSELSDRSAEHSRRYSIAAQQSAYLNLYEKLVAGEQSRRAVAI